jgi:anion transporter
MNLGTKDVDRYRRLKRLQPLLPLVATIGVAIAISSIPDLAIKGRLSLIVFCTTVIIWTSTKLNVSYVAILAALALVFTGTVPQTRMFAALGDQIVWLMIGAFILGAAIKQTGLSTRLTQLIVGQVKTVSGLFWMMTILIIPLSFLIPSTSGRAAVTLPIFRSVTGELRDAKITRALGILMPTIILVSTIVSLVGAGSHLIANELLLQMTQQHLSFGQWALYGLPFGVVASLLSCWVIMALFLDRDRRKQPIRLPASFSANTPLARSEWVTIGIALVMLGLWLTESLHGFKVATVAILGGVLLAMPQFGVMSWKDALKAVSWHLIMFVAAALVIGRSLVDSGAAQWAIDHTLGMSGINDSQSPISILMILTTIALTSHLYMTSHAARAVALVPALLSLAATLHLNPIAVTFIGTLGMDYCLTMPVSSKALLVYQDGDNQVFSARDLLGLSLVLLPLHLALAIGFYFTYWHWVGLRF